MPFFCSRTRWVLPSFALCKLVLRWVVSCMCLFEFWSSSCRHLRVERIDHRVALFLELLLCSPWTVNSFHSQKQRGLPFPHVLSSIHCLQASFGYAGSSLLCTGFALGAEWGLPSSWGAWLLTAVTSLVAHRPSGLSRCGSQALERRLSCGVQA